MVDALGGDEAFTVRIGAGGGSGLPTEPSELGPLLEAAIAIAGSEAELRLEAFTDVLLLQRLAERAASKPEAVARAAYALLDSRGSGGAVPFGEASERIAVMCSQLPLGDATLEAECEPAAIAAALEGFDYEERGHLSFECFARVVMRSSPSAWGTAAVPVPAESAAAAIDGEAAAEATALLVASGATLTVGQSRGKVIEWLLASFGDDLDTLRRLAKSGDATADARSLAADVAVAMFPEA